MKAPVHSTWPMAIDHTDSQFESNFVQSFWFLEFSMGSSLRLDKLGGFPEQKLDLELGGFLEFSMEASLQTIQAWRFPRA